MNMRDHIDSDDLTMFALMLLSEQDQEAVKAHLADCAACREELVQIRADLQVYAAVTAPAAVAEGARARFLAAVSATAQEVSAQTSSAQAADVSEAWMANESEERLAESERAAPESARNLTTVQRAALDHDSQTALQTALQAKGSARQASSLGRVLPWLGWAAAAAAIVVAAGLRQDRDALRAALALEDAQTASLQADAERARHIVGALTDPAAVRVNLSVPKAAATPSARATYEPKSGTLLLMASNLTPLPAEKVYELWLIPADGGAPRAAGTFSPDGHGNASLLTPSLGGAVAAKAFGITVEPVGGSATPTMPILLVGSAS